MNITLPEWVPLDAWAGYVDMRKKIKKPLATDRAVTLAINTLDKLREQGQDVAAVLDQSTMNSWQGLFAVAAQRQASQVQRSNFPSLGKHGQATANNLQGWLEDFA
jgi:hypothetical protein